MHARETRLSAVSRLQTVRCQDATVSSSLDVPGPSTSIGPTSAGTSSSVSVAGSAASPSVSTAIASGAGAAAALGARVRFGPVPARNTERISMAEDGQHTLELFRELFAQPSALGPVEQVDRVENVRS